MRDRMRVDASKLDPSKREADPKPSKPFYGRCEAQGGVFSEAIRTVLHQRMKSVAQQL